MGFTCVLQGKADTLQMRRAAGDQAAYRFILGALYRFIEQLGQAADGVEH